tara:strand:+ start:116464 stop:116835 length:372 start_codon:yes stop_codon:yes gene_type:complete
VKVTNRQLVGSAEAFKNLIGLKMPIKASFKLAKIVRIVEEELTDYKTALKSLQLKHAIKGEDDEPVIIENQYVFEDVAKFNAEYAELLGFEVSLDIEQISLEDLGDAEIEPAHLVSLLWLLKD